VTMWAWAGIEPGYAYTAREWDPETNLYFYRARYYDPSIGRFLSEDPADYQDGLTEYAYVLSNPIRLIDPSGRRELELPPYPKCGGKCPHEVFTAYFNVCADPRTDNAAVIRCTRSRCWTKREVQITCIDKDRYPCNLQFRGPNNQVRRMFGYVPPSQTDSIVMCVRPFQSCFERRLVHGLLHTCDPTASDAEVEQQAETVRCNPGTHFK
jgi:RHS repeat-associated protein